MRLCRLSLSRFGPFSDARLELGTTGGRLELVYGPNEAGKSTTLRAVSGLFYGIPERTLDDHLHPMRDLRIAGELRSAAGDLLEIERLKRRKNSLLDSEGRPLDESALTRFLGGVTLASFLHTFGLNHETLREAADALIEGKGEIGVSLFDAAMGGVGALSVLSQLEAEADALYSPRDRAGKREVNQALVELVEATARVNRAITPPQSFLDQEAELRRKTEELERVEARQRELRAEAERLHFALVAAPLFNEKERILREIAALGRVPILSPDAASRRERTVVDRESSKKEVAHFEAELGALRQKRASISVPAGLQSLDAERVAELAQRLGAHYTAENDLPKRRAELSTFEGERERLVQKLGPRKLEAHVDAATKERLRTLALAHREIDSAVERHRSDLVEQNEELSHKQSALEELGSVIDHEELARVLRAAERSGDLERAENELAGEIATLVRATKALGRALGLEDRGLCELAELAVPATETVERFERELERAERDIEQAEAALRSNADRIALVESEIAAIVRAGAVPTENELAEVRERRDHGWQELKGILAAPRRKRDDVDDLARGHERSLRESDDVADRLRREAERVARRAQLEAEHDAALQEKARRDAHLVECREHLRVGLAAWNAEWGSIRPKSPREMLGWLARFRELLAKLEHSNELEERKRATQAEIAEHRRAIQNALGVDIESLGALTDLASSELSARRETAQQRLALQTSIRDAKASIARTERRLHEWEAKLASWQNEWQSAVARIGMEASANPEEVHAVLGVLSDIERNDKDSRQLRDRIRGMERNAERLKQHVAELVREHSPDLEALEWPKAAQELARRHSEAMNLLVLGADLDRQISETESRLSQSREKLLHAEAGLAVLLEEAGVSDVAELREVEDRVRRHQLLEESQLRNDAQLADRLGTRTLEAAREEVRDVDLGEARARLVDIESEQEELGEKRDALRADQRGLAEGLSDLEASGEAAEAKADEQQLVARARSGLERYLKLTLAARILRREIERYREKHQGPVLARANDLFQKLTAGRYDGVRPDVDSGDVATLRAVRADGVLVDVKGLSDGARDQLYLALRLATLEHYATTSEPLPLVLDDVLVHFDDERARAALAVLAEVADKMQVLLFTHHAHVVSLAKTAVSHDKLVVHELLRRELPVQARTPAN